MENNLSVKQKQFIKELKELLLKYNAEIFWDCDEISDTYGLVDAHLVLSIQGQKDMNLSGTCVTTYELECLEEEDI